MHHTSLWPAMLTSLLLGAAPARGEQKPPVPAEGRPPMRLCSGVRDGNYYKAAQRIASDLTKKVAVEVIETKGSWENLERMDAFPRRCDAVIAQDDAYALYQFEKPKSNLTIDRISVLYPEYVHLLCNRAAGVEEASDLDGKRHKLLVGEFGSGTYITWRLFGKLNPAYQAIPTFEARFDEALLKVVDGTRAQCLFWVSGVRAPTFMTAHDQFGQKLRLVSMEDPRLLRKVGRDKRPVYKNSEIAQRIYPKLLSGQLATMSVDAVFFVSPEWKARNPKAAQALTSSLIKLIPELAKQFRGE